MKRKNILSSAEQTFFCTKCGTNLKGYPGGVDGDGELHQSPGPDDQDYHAQDFVGVHFVILKRNTLDGFKALEGSMDLKCTWTYHATILLDFKAP